VQRNGDNEIRVLRQYAPGALEPAYEGRSAFQAISMLESKNQALGGFVIMKNGTSAIEHGRDRITRCTDGIFTRVDLKWEPAARASRSFHEGNIAPAFAAQSVWLADAPPTRNAQRRKKEIEPLPAPIGRARARGAEHGKDILRQFPRFAHCPNCKVEQCPNIAKAKASL
jgi:hypothetical protein